jgi:NTP pyrophosphatase (non-canonical NTP hydrolase)|tara:strand:+ start:1883 stop:2239 length:357 start_codon:yes stop_codon:yes gene_type:complete
MDHIPNLDFYHFDVYQKEALTTAFYPNKGNNLYYPALGLAGESGEVCEKIKKIYRDMDGEVTESSKNDLVRELGDILWYVAALADEIDICLSEVAEENILKLSDRQQRDKLKGSGDNR